jgi:hypothetical protein
VFRSKWQEHLDQDEMGSTGMRSELGDERFRREMDCEFLIFDETPMRPVALFEMGGIDPRERHRTGTLVQKTTKRLHLRSWARSWLGHRRRSWCNTGG